LDRFCRREQDLGIDRLNRNAAVNVDNQVLQVNQDRVADQGEDPRPRSSAEREQ
jgi:hypothetical protein